MSTTTTTHPVTPEDLMALLDGELSADRSQFVSAHTETCADCQQAVTSLRTTSIALGAWSVAQKSVDSQFESRLRESAGAAQRKPQSISLGSVGAFLYRHWKIAGTAAALLIFFATLTLFLGPAAKMKSIQLSMRERGKNSIGLQQLPLQQLPMNRPINGRGNAGDGLVTLTQPGAVADNNGLFHGLGDHAQNSFSIDGQPIVDQQSRVFSGPMIARTISLAVLVKDFDAARKSVDSILARHNGYSASLTIQTPEAAGRSLQGSLRVPVPQLGAAVAELKSLGHVEVESQGGEEVTQQHADLVARLKVSRETEQRFLGILQAHTGTIYEILATEQAIAQERGKIEQMEAEQKNLEHRVDYASIDLSLSEEYKAKLDSAVPSVSTRFHNALVNGYRNVADTIVGLLLWIAEYTPILLFWAVLPLVPAWLAWRRFRQVATAS